MYNIYIIKLMNFYLSKNCMTFWYHIFDIVTFLIKKIDATSNKGVLCSTGNYSQYFIITYKGKESEKGYIHVHIYV